MVVVFRVIELTREHFLCKVLQGFFSLRAVCGETGWQV